MAPCITNDRDHGERLRRHRGLGLAAAWTPWAGSLSALDALEAWNLALFVRWNLTPVDPFWMVRLARISSAFLPGLALGWLCLVMVFGSSRWRGLVVQTLVAMAVVWLLVRGIHLQWPSPRPFVLGLGHAWIHHTPSTGFPSHHAAIAMAFGFSWLVASPNRWIGLLCLGTALLIAWSRVALGVHFPSDVLAGGLLAALVVSLVFLVTAHLGRPARASASDALVERE